MKTKMIIYCPKCGKEGRINIKDKIIIPDGELIYKCKYCDSVWSIRFQYNLEEYDEREDD